MTNKKDKKPLTIGEKWEIDASAGLGGIAFEPNPDAEDDDDVVFETIPKK